ncbi:MAG: YggS family pyridoxal phosphate-dependent enzyme [Pseudomonadota bacterium]|nr:YggS family pyridoxal phosphate-dependent enzyme [Pseudomonadota bacterium]
MNLETRKEWLDQRVNAAAWRVNREPAEISLLAVSKKQTSEAVRSLAALGQQSFGENYLQEALEKVDQLAELALEWHFIGQIQRNKTAAIAENFDWVQSIDRLVIAERLSVQRPEKKGKLNVCIQVRMSEEHGKGGIAADELLPLASAVSTLPGLVLRGLMTIPENTSDAEKQRASFHRMHDLFNHLRTQHASVDTLSMGMSGDFELAIEEGSTMIRVGTALFGPRN